MPLRMVPRRDRKLNREVKRTDLVPLRRGEVLWERGGPSAGLVLVRRGHLRLVVGGGPAERTIHVVGPWELTGEEALVPGARRRYGALAGEVAAVQWLDADAVTSVLSTSTVTRQAFLAAWMDDLADLGHVLAGSGGPDAAGRLASVLLHLGRRLGEDGDATIPLQLTHRTLADLAGIHRSTATTLLNEWLYQGWIVGATPGIRIEDRPALARCAGLAVPAEDPRLRPGRRKGT